MIRFLRLLGLSAGLVAQLSCGSWPGPGEQAVPEAGSLIPRLFDTAPLYGDMGLLTAGEPVPFVASVRWLAGPGPDSTLAVVAVSLSNSALSFRRAGDLFEARYRVDVVFRKDVVVEQIASEQTVRVTAFRETQRTDESLIFQQFVPLPPDTLLVKLSVRDIYGAGVSRVASRVTVPRFGQGPRLSSLVPVYRGEARTARGAVPDLVVNPRATAPYGSDTLSLYVEGYGLERRALVMLRALIESSGDEVWRDTLVLDSTAEVGVAVARIPTTELPVGRLRFEAVLAEVDDTVRISALVSFSDEWAVRNFQETLSLLRYFGSDARRREMLDAPLERRTELWRAFWRDTDPNPTTGENEAITEYIGRVIEANEKFREPTEAGWLTDRGEVFITLGEPDAVLESDTDFPDRGRRVIRWRYEAHRIVLDFVDETGFGRFRLTPSSRTTFLAVRARIAQRG